MITLLHGEDELTSRRELEKIIAEFPGQVIRFDKNFDKTEFYQAASGGIFSDKTLIILENYLSGKKKLDIDLANISGDLVFFENKEVSKTLTSGFRVLEFKLPTLIWKFTDSLKPISGKYLVGLYREVLKQTDPEFIFAMLIRQFRLMLDPTGLPAWQAGKIKTQAKVFGEKHLMEIYRKLLEIDFEQKNGLTPFTLSSKIEMLILWI